MKSILSWIKGKWLLWEARRAASRLGKYIDVWRNVEIGK